MKYQALLQVLCVLTLCHHANTTAVTNTDKGTANNVCQTAICKEEARIFLEYMDLTKDPCKDFFEFKCGGYIAKHVLSPDKSHNGAFVDTDDLAKKQIKEILETPDKNDFPELTKAKVMYANCLRKDDDTAILKEEILRLGGWPITAQLGNGSSTNIALEDILSRIGRVTVNAILKTRVDPDIKHNSVYILQTSQGSIPSGRETLLQPVKFKHLLDEYRKYLTTAASIMGAPNSTETEKQIDDILEFERKLAKITLKPEEKRNLTKQYNKMTVAELQKLTDPTEKIFNWNIYFNKMNQLEFNNSEPVVVSEVKYIKEAMKIIQSTDHRTVLNFIVWSFVKTFAWPTGGKMLDASSDFKRVHEGLKKDEPRWHRCTADVDNAWGFAVGRPFVDKHLSAESKEQVRQIIETLREAFSQRLKNVSFFDKPTLETAQKKLAAMDELVAYPDWIHNDTAQHEYYIDYPQMTKSFLLNIIGTHIGDFARKLKKLRKPVDKTEFHMAPPTINAMYSLNKNQLLIPAGILHTPFFRSGRPLAMNYGGIGVVAGHEITHGFDDKGSQFDMQGNLKNWWPAKVHEAFLNETHCFINQYSHYCPTELDHSSSLCINGKATQGENIADNGGLASSFLAYKNVIAKHGSDQVLPGLENFSPEKLFFLSFAHVWCSAATPQYLTNRILYNPHTPDQFRIIGTLSNSKEFAETFQCPPGPMNRDSERCVLW